MSRRPLLLALGALLGPALACSGGEPSPAGGQAGQTGLNGGGVGGFSSAGAFAGQANAASGIGPTGGVGTATSGAAAGGAAGTSAAGNAAGGAGTSGGSSAQGGRAGAAGTGGAATHAFKGVANSACADLNRLSASWWYNWTTAPSGCQTNEFVPMIAGKAEKTPAAVQSALGKIKAAGYRTVLGFNEPNKADQANLTVAQVIELWPTLTADSEVRVGSASTSADAKAWFEDYMAQVEAKSLRVDFVAIHWYGWNAGSCNDAKELEGYLTWAEKFKRPIWITEFGCMNQSNPSADVVKNFYAAAVEMLGRHSSVERYAWYPWNTNNELVLTGNLTALGTTFSEALSVR